MKDKTMRTVIFNFIVFLCILIINLFAIRPVFATLKTGDLCKISRDYFDKMNTATTVNLHFLFLDREMAENSAYTYIYCMNDDCYDYIIWVAPLVLLEPRNISPLVLDCYKVKVGDTYFYVALNYMVPILKDDIVRIDDLILSNTSKKVFASINFSQVLSRSGWKPILELRNQLALCHLSARLQEDCDNGADQDESSLQVQKKPSLLRRLSMRFY